MNTEIEIHKMTERDIGLAIEIWVKQLKDHNNEKTAFPSYWKENTDEIRKFLTAKVSNHNAMTARIKGALVGYLAYDEFPFHGELSTFCPIPAHASVDDNKKEIYQTLYAAISQEWVDKNIFNHMWTINYNNTELRDTLFDLGFGSHTIDGFSISSRTVCDTKNFEVKKASIDDVDKLHNLVEESARYYKASPIFLKRDPYTREGLEKLISKNGAHVAQYKDNIIGFINVSVSTKNNLIDMTTENMGMIDEIGIFITSEYRGKGLGKELLQAAFDYCKDRNIQTVHVDFETANLHGNVFWRKYFDLSLLSLRRTINKNINS